jgi:lipoprotein-anchoring transpeptidase ErfK/SrfK
MDPAVNTHRGGCAPDGLAAAELPLIATGFPMNSDTTDANQAIQNSIDALRRENRAHARYWAQRAVWLEPECEQAWLALAGVSNPTASLEYLQRALAINPESQAARDELARVQETLAAQKVARRAAQLPVRRLGKKPGIFYRFKMGLFGLILITISLVALLAIAWIVLPDERLSVQAVPPTQEVAETPTPAPAVVYQVLPSPTFPTHPSPSPTSPIPTPTMTPLPTATALVSTQPAEDELLLSENAALTVTPTPTADPSNQRIDVDISEQHMYVYEGEALVYSFVVSTGKGGGTLTGDFKVLDKIENAWSLPWGFWMPDWMGIYYVNSGLENGIHSLPVMPDGREIWGDQIGKPISYGCVVLQPDDSLLLYNWASVGTPVIIHQ